MESFIFCAMKSMDWFLYDRDLRYERVNIGLNMLFYWNSSTDV